MAQNRHNSTITMMIPIAILKNMYVFHCNRVYFVFLSLHTSFIVETKRPFAQYKFAKQEQVHLFAKKIHCTQSSQPNKLTKTHKKPAQRKQKKNN